MFYEYQWTEDGETELGTIEKRMSTEDTDCYHCGRHIGKSEFITLFKCEDTYTICQECSRRLFRLPAAK